MTTTSPSHYDRELVLDVLTRAESRIRRLEQVQQLVAGSAGSLALPLALAIWRLIAPVPAPVTLGVLIVWLIALASYVVWIMTRTGTLASAAASLDAREDLKDELKSACWFAEQNLSSPWIDRQIKGAARTAKTIDLLQIYPWMAPASARAAAGLVLVLVVLNLVPTGWTRGRIQAISDITTLSGDERMALEDVRDLLEEATPGEATEAQRQLEEILALLDEGSITIDEALARLEALDQALELDDFDAAGLDQALADMADILKESEALQEAAEALSARDLEEAADALREAGENLDDAGDAAAQEMQESLEKAGEASNPELQDLADSLEKTAEELEAENLEAAKESLEQAAQNLEELAKKQSQQALQDAARQQVRKLQESVNTRRDAEGQQSEQSEQGEPEGGDDQGQGAEQSPMAPGNTGEPSQRQTDPSGQRGEDASQGDMSGAPSDGPPEQSAPTAFEVTLREEVLASQLDPDNPGQREIVDQASRSAESTLEFQEIAPGRDYADPDPLGADTIPWPYRDLVKDYFAAVGPRGQHDY